MKLSKVYNQIYIIGISKFLTQLAFYLVEPLVVLIMLNKGFSAIMSGAFASMIWVASVLAAPFTEKLISAFGLRNVFLFTAVLNLISFYMLSTASMYSVLLLSAFLLGVSGGVRWVSSEAAVAELAPEKTKGMVIGAYETFMGLTFMLGPFLASTLNSLKDGPYIAAYCLVSASIIASLFIKKIHVTESGEETSVRPWNIIIKSPGLVIAAFIGGFYESGPSTIVSVYAMHAGFTISGALALISVIGLGSFSLQFPIGFLSDRFSAHKVIIVSIALTSCASSLLFFTTSLSWPLWVVSFIFGGVGGCIFTVAMIELGSSYKGSQLIGSTACIAVFYTLGSSIAPVISGVFYQIDGFYGVPSFLIIIGLLAIALILKVPRCSAAMSSYSPERKAALLSKLLPPQNMSVAELSCQEGISQATLHAWRAKLKAGGAVVHGDKNNADDWPAEA